jgi:hypothetical protein
LFRDGLVAGVDLNPSVALITRNLLIVRQAKRARSPSLPNRCLPNRIYQLSNAGSYALWIPPRSRHLFKCSRKEIELIPFGYILPRLLLQPVFLVPRSSPPTSKNSRFHIQERSNQRPKQLASQKALVATRAGSLTLKVEYHGTENAGFILSRE